MTNDEKIEIAMGRRSQLERQAYGFKLEYSLLAAEKNEHIVKKRRKEILSNIEICEHAMSIIDAEVEELEAENEKIPE